MPTQTFSADSAYWRPLCVNTLRPETSVNGNACSACVIPLPPPVEECGGTSPWQWSEATETWTLMADECTGGGTPVLPAIPPTGTFDGQIMDFPCDCP